MGVDIWYNGYCIDGDPTLHCRIHAVDIEHGTIGFSIINGAWDGILYMHKNLIAIGASLDGKLYKDTKFMTISKFELIDHNVDKFVEKLSGSPRAYDAFLDDDIPF